VGSYAQVSMAASPPGGAGLYTREYASGYRRLCATLRPVSASGTSTTLPVLREVSFVISASLAVLSPPRRRWVRPQGSTRQRLNTTAGVGPLCSLTREPLHSLQISPPLRKIVPERHGDSGFPFWAKDVPSVCVTPITLVRHVLPPFFRRSRPARLDPARSAPTLRTATTAARPGHPTGSLHTLSSA